MRIRIEEHFLSKNPEYNIIYHTLLKEARVWNSIGQYWLGKDCERRATALLNNNIEEYKIKGKSEELFYKTKRF